MGIDDRLQRRKRRGDERRQRDLLNHPPLGLNKDPVLMCKLPIFKLVFLKFLYIFPQMFLLPIFNIFFLKCFYSQFARKQASKQQPKKLERGEMRERKTQ
jgi:hypothetical protein